MIKINVGWSVHDDLIFDTYIHSPNGVQIKLLKILEKKVELKNVNKIVKIILCNTNHRYSSRKINNTTEKNTNNISDGALKKIKVIFNTRVKKTTNFLIFFECARSLECVILSTNLNRSFNKKVPILHEYKQLFIKFLL